jgi:hypothetical protein
MNKTIIYQRVALVVAVVLLLLLVGAQLLPLIYNVPSLVVQTTLQGTRAQRIAKDALVLEYRPAGEHAQAINEIQNSLPIWEAQQTYLSTLQSSAVQTLMAQAQPDYLAIDTAARNLLAHTNDTTQTNIIVQHERNYTLVMNQLSQLIQDRIQEFKVDVIIIQCVITVLELATVVGLFLLTRQSTVQKEAAS